MLLKETKNGLKYRIITTTYFKYGSQTKRLWRCERFKGLEKGRALKENNFHYKVGKELSTSEKLKDQCFWMEHSDKVTEVAVVRSHRLWLEFFSRNNMKSLKAIKRS